RARAAEAEGRLQSTLAEVQRALASAEQRAAETDRERALQAARLEEAVAREQQLRDERNAVLQRSATEREDMLNHALGVERKADQARVTAMVELEALRTAFGHAQKQILEAEDRVAPEHQALLRYAAEAHQQLEEARAAATTELESVRTELAEVQAEVLAAR